jgi:hypothetical protein
MSSEHTLNAAFPLQSSRLLQTAFISKANAAQRDNFG